VAGAVRGAGGAAGWCGCGVADAINANNAAAPAPRTAFLLAFVAVAYLVWMRMFSIYRYLVPLELLAPLAIWLAWQYIAPQAQRVAGVLLAALALGVFPIANWGHAEWADQAFSAEVPPSRGRPTASCSSPSPTRRPAGWPPSCRRRSVSWRSAPACRNRRPGARASWRRLPNVPARTTCC
jgi:hypothetical protein